MVIGLSLLVNVAVFFDFENRISRCVKAINPFRRINLADDDDDDPDGSYTKAYLDRRTQLILLLAGVRGAVSFALVENIPVWDNVSKTGSQFKAELKAMTSSSIVFTLFFFGALTYMAVKHGSDSDSDRARAALTNRLLSEPLESGFETQSQSQSRFSESRSDGHHAAMSNGQPLDGTGAQQVELNNLDSRYQSSNEWI
eukprot:jgi/Psemu1/306442/fgenesh1_kg.258_\